MHTRDRAIGAASSREGADRLQHRTDQELGARDSRGKKHEVDFGEYRKHADAIAPKYAGKRTLPIVHHEIPKMDPKVGSLMHELGEAHKKRVAHLTQHAQLKGQVKAATSQLASRPSPGRLPGEEMAVQQEIAAAKKAVRMCVCACILIYNTHTHMLVLQTHTHAHINTTYTYIHTYIYTYQARTPNYRAAFKPMPRGLFRGGTIEANVEREIAAARRGAHHHLPYGRLQGHEEAAGVLPSGMRERCLCLRFFRGGCGMRCSCTFLSAGLAGNYACRRACMHACYACRRACMHACLLGCTPLRFSRVESTLSVRKYVCPHKPSAHSIPIPTTCLASPSTTLPARAQARSLGTGLPESWRPHATPRGMTKE